MRFTPSIFALLVGVAQLTSATLTSTSREPKGLASDVSEDESDPAMGLLMFAAPGKEDKEERNAFVLEGLGKLKGMLPASQRKILRGHSEAIRDEALVLNKFGLAPTKLLTEDSADRSKAVVKYFASNEFKVWSDLVKESWEGDPVFGVYIHLVNNFGYKAVAEMIELSKSSYLSVAKSRGEELEKAQFAWWYSLQEPVNAKLEIPGPATDGVTQPSELTKAIIKNYNRYYQKRSRRWMDPRPESDP